MNQCQAERDALAAAETNRATAKAALDECRADPNATCTAEAEAYEVASASWGEARRNLTRCEQKR